MAVIVESNAQQPGHTEIGTLNQWLVANTVVQYPFIQLKLIDGDHVVGKYQVSPSSNALGNDDQVIVQLASIQISE